LANLLTFSASYFAKEADNRSLFLIEIELLILFSSLNILSALPIVVLKLYAFKELFNFKKFFKNFILKKNTHNNTKHYHDNKLRQNNI